MQVSKILLTRDRPEQFPFFLVRSFQWNQTTMIGDEAAFPKLIIFFKIQLIVWIACYFTVFMMLKTSFQDISKTLSQNLFNLQVSKILLTRDRPEQFPFFLVRSFQWNQTTMIGDEAAFPKLIIFFKIQLIVWIACYFTVFMMLKTSFQDISKTLSQNLFKLCHN